ncbi:hypothetical protein ACFVYR_36000 [Streptomyces sp. NPDC058284]|uniref:hypothetical protein n=1 Tax=unclassified Streptomyces TaxID=2593676 RepID=UPI003659F537
MSDHSGTHNHPGVETAPPRQLVEQALVLGLRSVDDLPVLAFRLGVIEGIPGYASLLSDVLHTAVERMPREWDLRRRVQTTLGEDTGGSRSGCFTSGAEPP